MRKKNLKFSTLTASTPPKYLPARMIFDGGCLILRPKTPGPGGGCEKRRVVKAVGQKISSKLI
jgi:hypothetical protein